MANPCPPSASEKTPIATLVSLPPSSSALARDATPRRLRKYRGGFTSSLCDVFRDPRRRTDCCAVACCGVLSSDRTRYLLTGERPPPLWLRMVLCAAVPGLFLTALQYFAVEVDGTDDGGETADGGGGTGDEGGTVRVAPPGLVVAFVAYVVACFVYNCVRGRNTRKEIMKRLYEERAGGAEQVTPAQVQSFLTGHNLEITRAHSCCSCLYPTDDLFDEAGGALGGEEPGEDFCTRLWTCLSHACWGCCGCWCQCCGLCAVAQEEREVDRLVPEHAIDYLTFEPHSDYHPRLQHLVEHRERSPWKHLRALSELSSKLLKNVAAVLVVLFLAALIHINDNFTLENMVVLLLTLGQACFIEYFVHWKWNLFDLSLDSVVKYFACGFFLSTPSAIVLEIVVSIAASVITFVFGLIVVSSDSKLLDQFDDDPKQAAEEVVLNYPAIFVLYNFLNAFVVAALVEETVKHFGYRMVVTPDLLPGRAPPVPGNGGAGSGTNEESPARSMVSHGAGITVAMVSTALGFACCENLMYVFVYSPPSLGVEISTLLSRSLFPVHPLCAAIQSIGVCARDLEGNKNIGLGRIIFPAVLLHGAFDFVLMLAAYFQKVESIREGNDDVVDIGADNTTEDLAAQLPSMVAGAVFIIIGCAYYVIQSRSQTQRLVALDSAARELNSPLV